MTHSLPCQRFRTSLLFVAALWVVQGLAALPVHADEPSAPLLDVLLVLDNSGSMIDNDPDLLMQQWVIGFLSQLKRSDRVGMVVFDREPRLVEPLASVSDLGARARMIQALEKVDYRGQFSDFPAAVERAVYELRNAGRPDARPVIILLTDGIVDTGDPNSDREKRDWLRQELRRESEYAEIRIFGIVFTEQADFSLIQMLAVHTGGHYFRAFRMEDVTSVLAAIQRILEEAPSRSETESRIPESEPGANVAQAPPKTVSAPPPPSSAPTQPQKKVPAPPVRETGSSLPTLFSGAVVAVLALALVWAIRIRRRRPGPSEGEKRIPPAKLLDLKNVTGRGAIPLDSPVVRIGRDHSNDIVIPEKTVSSLHAVLEYRNSFFWLEDQRSRNQTLVNGENLKPYEPRRLKSGDEIGIHDVRFQFFSPDAAPSGGTVKASGKVSPAAPAAPPSLRPAAAPASATDLPKALLVDVRQITGQKTLPLDKDRISIGRSLHNDVVIAEGSISGTHAVIVYRDGHFCAEDQRTRSGTRINGEELRPHVAVRLNSGDELIFAVYKFIFLLPERKGTDTGGGVEGTKGEPSNSSGP